VNEKKDLVVIISANLKPSQQCSVVYNKAIKKLGMINRTIEFKKRKICLYKLNP